MVVANAPLTCKFATRAATWRIR